ncbi:hypothetical protein ACOMHN_013436 [Nucella lapillus]
MKADSFTLVFNIVYIHSSCCCVVVAVDAAAAAAAATAATTTTTTAAAAAAATTTTTAAAAATATTTTTAAAAAAATTTTTTTAAAAAAATTTTTAAAAAAATTTTTTAAAAAAATTTTTTTTAAAAAAATTTTTTAAAAAATTTTTAAAAAATTTTTTTAAAAAATTTTTTTTTTAAAMSSGLWNCSVQHYTSFHQHLACNLKAECEDGRDETGPCPYSSTHCHGMIALCGRCYTIVDSLTLDLSHTPLTVLDTTVLALFPKLQKLNLTSTTIHTISPEGFQYTPLLAELYMDKSPVKTFPADMFKTLSSLCYVSTQNYKLCCREILPSNFSSSNCIAPKDEISSCEDLLQSWTYRGFLWLVACLSLTGNVFCCCARLFAKSLASSSGFSVFVANLTIADFLMGVYITIIGVADERFRGRYLYKDDIWKHSVTCKVAGFLSLLSSEVSALIIWFITLDRFIVLRFPFSTVRFNRTSAAVACLLTWLAGWCLAVLPLLPLTSHWEFYSQTGICVPLPVTRQDFKGRVYSFSVLIVLNFIVFLFISAGQALIYWTIQNNALKTDSTKVSQDMTIARRLITIAVTDFLCWFPIGLCGLLALAGTPIPGEVNVVLAIFVLPLNSAINPFLYTLNTLAEKRRNMREVKLLHWLKSHPDLIG